MVAIAVEVENALILAANGDRFISGSRSIVDQGDEVQGQPHAA